MTRAQTMLAAAALAAGMAGATNVSAQTQAPPAGAGEIGPDRLVVCTIGRVTNMTARTQAELALEGEHKLIILQPDAAIEYDNKPPRPSSAARLVRFHDPDKVLIADSVSMVIDAWPKAIDFLTRQPDGSEAFVSLGSIALANNTAMVSVGLIQPDRETLDPRLFYQGNCSFEVAPGLTKKFNKLAKAKR